MLNSTVNQGDFPKLVCKLIEQGHTSADAQIKELLTDIQYPENLYAIKYVLEHGESVSSEVLIATMESLYPQKTNKVLLKEEPINLEWQLRIVMIILEQLCERKS